MQAMLAPQSKDERKGIKAALDIDLSEVLTLDNLIKSDDAFFAATGVTDGPMLEGIHYDRRGGVTTHSIVIRALSGSTRYIKGVHQLKQDSPSGPVDVEEAVKIATQ
jgi:fructose-1,6-bisphosphatase II